MYALNSRLLYLQAHLLVLQLFQLRETAERIVCQAVDEFKGGYTHKLLSRSQLFEKPGDNGQLLATFGDEASTSVSCVQWLNVLSVETGSVPLWIPPIGGCPVFQLFRSTYCI